MSENRDGAKGYEARDFDAEPFGSVVAPAAFNRYPRSEWDELARMQDEYESSPWHVHKHNKIPVLNQRSLPYCWMYGTVGAVMNRYGALGLDPVPHLSATGPAAQGKRWAKRGGWATEAVKYIEKYGIPTVEAWPNTSMDRGLPQTEPVMRTSKMHGIVRFEELPSRDFEAAMSVLLDPLGSHPVTMGLNWWRHLVCGLKAAKVNGQWGIIIVNSWGTGWKDGGFGFLQESKATAHEYVKVSAVKGRMEDV